MIETYATSCLTLMGIYLFKNKDSFQRKYADGLFYFLILFLSAFTIELLTDDFNILKYQYAKFQLGEIASLLVTFSIKAALLAILELVFSNKYSRILLKYGLVEAISFGLLILAGANFEDYILCSFLLYSWLVFKAPITNNDRISKKVECYQDGKVVELFKNSEEQELSSCPVDRVVGKAHNIKQKKHLSLSLKFYLMVQLVVTAIVLIQIVSAFNLISTDEMILYSLYIILTMSSLGRSLDQNRLNLAEILRHILFLAIETSYWEKSNMSIELNPNLPLVLISFISLNWYLIMNIEKLPRINLLKFFRS